MQNWLSNLDFKDKISGVQAQGIATYFVDSAGDWDALVRGDRIIVISPWPELKDLKLSADGLKIIGSLSDVERAAALPLIEENVTDLLRQEEESRRTSRTEGLRSTIKTFVVDRFHIGPSSNVDVLFVGEPGANDEGSSTQ